MDPQTYQREAARTECDQERSRERMFGGHISASYSHDDTCRRPIRMNHAVIGLMGEVGELAAALERWIYYGRDLDLLNVGEEVGDCLWYLSLLCNATGMSMSTIMEANITKLRARYPEKYSDYHAASENRNREAERKTLEEIYPSDLPSYDPQQEHEARQCADEDADSPSLPSVKRHDTGLVNPTEQAIDDLLMEGNVGRELEKEVMEEVSSHPVGKEITKVLNRHEDPTGQSDALLRIGEVGKSVVAGHSRETAALGVPTPRDPNLEVVKEVDRAVIQDWLCACWDGASGVHVNPPYDINCGRCGRRRAPAPMIYPTEQQFKEEVEARGSSLFRMPHVWQCPSCQQVNAAGNVQCVYCGKIPLEEVAPTRLHPSHDWHPSSSNQVYQRCRRCGAYQHLLSGFMPCLPTAPEPKDEPLEQDGHGWAEPPVSEEEGGKEPPRNPRENICVDYGDDD